MDDKDHALLAALRRDGRRPLTALAGDIGLSRSATQERLERLRRTGVIQGFTIIEAPSAQPPLAAHLLLRLDPGRRCAEVVPRLRQINGILAIHSVAGPIDLILHIEGPSMAAIETIRAAVAALNGIAEVSTHLVLERHLG